MKTAGLAAGPPLIPLLALLGWPNAKGFAASVAPPVLLDEGAKPGVAKGVVLGKGATVAEGALVSDEAVAGAPKTGRGAPAAVLAAGGSGMPNFRDGVEDVTVFGGPPKDRLVVDGVSVLLVVGVVSVLLSGVSSLNAVAGPTIGPLAGFWPKLKAGVEVDAGVVLAVLVAPNEKSAGLGVASVGFGLPKVGAGATVELLGATVELGATAELVAIVVLGAAVLLGADTTAGRLEIGLISATAGVFSDLEVDVTVLVIEEDAGGALAGLISSLLNISGLMGGTGVLPSVVAAGTVGATTVGLIGVDSAAGFGNVASSSSGSPW